MSTVNSRACVPFQSDHHSRVCFDVTRQSNERFDIANINFPSAIFRIDHDSDREIRRVFFDKKVYLAFYLREFAD